VNCAVLCVKDDWKDGSEACDIACQNCAIYLLSFSVRYDVTQ
jgi:hypothetical protein